MDSIYVRIFRLRISATGDVGHVQCGGIVFQEVGIRIRVVFFEIDGATVVEHIPNRRTLVSTTLQLRNILGRRVSQRYLAFLNKQA